MANKITLRAARATCSPRRAHAWDRIEGGRPRPERRYAFERIEIPLFERVELFARGLGESSDAVEKEMFRVSRGDRAAEEARAEWALRPEPTAGIVRAYIEHGMHVRPGPLRLWMHRADVPLRPPAGGPLPAVHAVGRRGASAIPDRWSTPS